MKVEWKIHLLDILDGDDFVALVPGNSCERLCQNILAHFGQLLNMGLGTFYQFFCAIYILLQKNPAIVAGFWGFG